jgi:hypothetical protein
MKHAIAVGLAAAAVSAMVYGIAKADSNLSAANLATQLSIDSTEYKASVAGQESTMQATFTIRNPTNETVTYLQAGLPVDWRILDSQGHLVYNVNQGKIIPHFIARRILRPGEHQDYNQTIALRNQAGDPLPTGPYVLQARLTTAIDLQSKKSFTVK